MPHLPRSIEKLIAEFNWEKINNYGFHKECYRLEIKLDKLAEGQLRKIAEDCSGQNLELMIGKYYKDLKLKTFSMCSQDKRRGSMDIDNRVLSLFVVNEQDYQKVQEVHRSFKRCSGEFNVATSQTEPRQNKLIVN